MGEEIEVSTYREAVVVLLGILANGCEFAKKVTNDLVSVWEAALSDAGVEPQDMAGAARRYLATPPTKWPGTGTIIDLARHVKGDRQRREVLRQQIENRNAPALAARAVSDGLRAEMWERLGVTAEEREARKQIPGVLK